MISFKKFSLFLAASFLFFVTFSFNNAYAQIASFPSSGNPILINTTVNVRDNPSVGASLLGTQPRGATGVVVGGPVTANGFIWWNVDYASGPDGWSVENYIVPAGSNLNLASNNLYFKAIPSSINAGETSTLVYSPVNATSCSSSQFNASVARGGTALITPTATKTYSVTCNGPWGSVTKSVTVTVGGSVPVVPPVVATGSPKITLTYPVGGEVFKNVDVKTTITNIRWSTTDFGSLPVNIILLDNSGYIIRWIATGISNTGNYTWFGDPSLPTGKYKVSVSSSDKGPSTSSASGLFEVNNPTYGTVGTPSITVLTPVGGSGYDVPGGINVVWSGTGFTPKNIVFYLNGSPLVGQQTPILATLGATTQSSYFATLPNVPSGTDYTISVCDEGTPSPVVSFKPLCGTSAPFSIAGYTPTIPMPSITAISPSSGSTNSTITIYGTNLVSNYTGVQFFDLNGRGVGSLNAPSVTSVNSNSLTFTIPPTFIASVPAGTYQVNVVTNNCKAGCDSNKIGFTIVKPNTTTAPIVTLTANPTTVNPGQPATIYWSATNATSCSSASWNQTGVSGSAVVYPSQTTNYSVVCSGPGGKNNNTVTVNVTTTTVAPKAAIADIKANNSDGPITLTSGQNLTLSWTSSNATFCSLGSPQNSGVLLNDTSVIIPSHPFYPKTNTTYSITCSGSSGTVTDSVTVNVLGAAPLPTVLLAAVPTSGGSYQINWSSTNATSCVSSGDGASWGWPSTRYTSGGSVTPVITTTQTFTMTCTGPGGTTSNSVTINSGTTTPAIPTVTVSANPTSVNAGQPVTISWSSTNATSCSSEHWNQTGVSGSAVVYPAQTTNYSVVCSGFGGKSNNTVNVTVNSAATISVPAPSVILTANNFKNSLTINKGDKLTLSWSSTGATSCSLADGMAMNSVVATSGTQTVFPNQNPTTYTVTCSNSGGASSKSVVVTVNGGIAQTNQLNQIANALAAIQALIVQMRGR